MAFTPLIGDYESTLSGGTGHSEGEIPDYIEGSTRGHWSGEGEIIVPTCWSYTAKYKNSQRLFRLNGPDEFPKTLRVPKNVDISTGIMIDEGELIDPSKYNIEQ